MVATQVFDRDLETRLFINGEFVDSSDGKTFPTVNPATAEVIAHVQEAGEANVEAAVKAATDAFALGSEWRSMNATGRRDCMLRLADLIERDRAYLEKLESLDNGKPLGRGEYGSSVDLHLVIQCYRYYAGWADKITGNVVPVDGNFLCYTRHEPIGVCGAIIPWNFPLLMQAWKMAPCLATGNTIVLKTSEKTPLSALHVAKLTIEAGFPKGVVNILSGFGPTTGQQIAKHHGIHKIAFTGSTKVGHMIQQYASESNLKRCSLELGGKSPMIIFDDADIDQAVNAAFVGLFLNQGQCCCAGSRLYVQESIHDKVAAALTAKAKAMKIGAALDVEDASHGPQVDELQFNRVMGYLEKGKAEGATPLCGGSRHGDKGYFIQPTVFTDVTDDMTIAKEEIFGPVMSILKFKDEAEVIERANKTCYGLGAGVCSTNIGRALSVAHQIRAGTVWVNSYDVFDAAAPFGGFKESGHGRDLGKESLEVWTECKTVFVPLNGPQC